MKSVTSVFLIVTMLSLALAVPPTSTLAPQGRTIVVTSTADRGPGALRQALLDAQSGDTITFDPTVFPPAAPATILLNAEDNDSALPNITQGSLTIDASNAGVILDGSAIQGDWVNGLEIYSDGNTVRGLQIVNFSGSGIALCGGSYNTIGGDRRIGTGPLGQGILSSNNGIGIDLCAQESFSTVTGNLIGTDPTGAKDWGNQFCGICIENGVRDTTVGPDNIIAYNDTGILVTGPEAFGNTITQNSIHDNGSFGIRLWDGGNTMLDPPLISDFDVAMGTVTGAACANCTIEIFSDSGGEGEVYEGQSNANSTDTFTFDKGAFFTGPHLTATATDADGNTSEFSRPTYALFVVNSTADSGPGTLRQALLDAQSGDTITFDPVVFPPSAPVAISLTSGLPEVTQGNLTIDASNAGVILDGSNIGTTLQTVLLDDVSLTLDGGPNLIANGNFTAGLSHWRPWDIYPGATRNLNITDFTSPPGSYEWSSVAHAGDSSTVYDTTDKSDPFEDWPYLSRSTAWITAQGGDTAELRFWYRQGGVGATLHALFSDGHTEEWWWWFDEQADWTEAVASHVLPANVVSVALALHNRHSKCWTHGLSTSSSGNTVQGLEVINFPGTGIGLRSGAQNNTIGGDRSVGSGPLGRGNLTSGNFVGIDIQDDGTSFNTVTGNLIGTDVSGLSAQGNRETGIFVANGASDNVIGPDNVIAHNGGNGVHIVGPNTLRNMITQNSIHDNGEWGGIDLQYGANAELAAPFITDFDLGIGTVMGTACDDCTVEIFSDSSAEGEVYEGQATVDASGFFTFSKGVSLTGPHLTATATDVDGNTSEFSTPTSGTHKSTLLQEGNKLPRIRLQPKQSRELEDNRIGVHFSNLWHLEPEVFPGFVLDASNILTQGFKRARFAINDLDSPKVDWSKPELSIDPSHDEFIASLADNGVTITFVLSFWDKAYKAGGGEIPVPRFKTEEEIQRYLDFVRFIVRHFKDRIEYYEIWNEPTIVDTIQWIEVEDYINLVDRAVSVIRQEYPEAKTVVGGTSSLIDTESQTYFFYILRSNIIPLVDAVSWHPMYGTSPEDDLQRQYYYEYPSIVQEIKAVASAHGFTGEYVADEIHWNTPDLPAPPWPTYSEPKSAKYLSRSIVMHLGMDVFVTQLLLPDKPLLFRTNQNLCTVMAGAEPASLPIQIQSTVTNTVSYTFSLPTGAHLIAFWKDGAAVDDDPGIPGTLTIPDFPGYTVIGIDVLHGFQQQLVTSEEDGNLVIRDLLVKDYPIIFRVTPTKYVFLPLVLKGRPR